METDYTVSPRVFDGIRRKLGQEICEKAFQAFLSDRPGKEMMVLRYLAALGPSSQRALADCLKYGPQMDSYRTHPDILGVHEASLRVGREAHRFLGWLRFSEIQGVLYAVYEPEADLTCLIMPHFADRFLKQRLVIDDLGRKKAGVYANGYWEEQELKQDLRSYKSSEELHMEKAWQAYFDHIAIKERENRKLQRQFMPVKISKNLTEQVIQLEAK